MSDTPRTDAEVESCANDLSADRDPVVYASFARELERENAELLGLLDRVLTETQGGDYCETGPTLRDLIYAKVYPSHAQDSRPNERSSEGTNRNSI